MLERQDEREYNREEENNDEKERGDSNSYHLRILDKTQAHTILYERRDGKERIADFGFCFKDLERQ